MATIVKASGEIAQFDKEKLRRSLLHVGAGQAIVDEIVERVEETMHSGMTTREIYRIARRLLRKKSKVSAAKYHLKRAILKLGTSGFPFEKYFAELLRHQNMKVITDTIVSGKCVNHEVDILAKDKNTTIFVECKFHNIQGIKTDLKVCLYVKARFEDLRWKTTNSASKTLGWLVTNTRFSSDAIKYGICAKVHLIGWDFPTKGSLKDLIDSSGLYPITCLTSLNKTEITQLLADGIVLCKNIIQSPHMLDRLRIPEHREKVILEQCEKLCSGERFS